MSKIKITLEDAKSDLRDAATGPRSEHWSYAPAVKALLNSHDELLAILGEATAALEEKEQRIEAMKAEAEGSSQHAEAAVKTLQGLAYTYHGGVLWKPPLGKKPDFDLVSVMRERAEAAEHRLQQPIRQQWVGVADQLPDPDSDKRVCVYTPSEHGDLRYRSLPASLFKTVCSSATHWHYFTAPDEQGLKVEGE